MKVQNKWIMLFFFILSLLGLAYYFYARPYVLLASDIEVSAAFPSKPHLLKIDSNFSSDMIGKVQSYQLSMPGITYLLSISKVKEEALVKYNDAAILNYFYKDINLLNNIKFRNSQAASYKQYNGLSIAFTSPNKILYGKFFLTTDNIVSVFVRTAGNTLTQEGRMFIDSFDIHSR